MENEFIFLKDMDFLRFRNFLGFLKRGENVHPVP